MAFSHLGNPIPGPRYILGISPRLEVLITHLGRKYGLRDLNTSGLIMLGVGLANQAPADGGMAHSPYIYQKRFLVYRVYSWELAESPVDRLRGEDSHLGMYGR